jgi:hypothetical protein
MKSTLPAPWSMELDALPDEVPPPVRHALQIALIEIVAVIDELPAGSLALGGRSGEELQLVLQGWRFAYEVLLETRLVRIVSAIRPRSP